MADTERKLQDLLNRVEKESDKKRITLTARRQNLWPSARVKFQDSIYKLEMLT